MVSACLDLVCAAALRSICPQELALVVRMVCLYSSQLLKELLCLSFLVLLWKWYVSAVRFGAVVRLYSFRTSE